MSPPAPPGSARHKRRYHRTYPEPRATLGMAPTLLPEAASDTLVSTCRDIAGDRLRSVTYFTRDDFDQLYLRSDLERGADLASFIGFEWRESWITEDAYQGTELGEHEYTLQAFENGYLLRVETPTEGAFVTLDRPSLEVLDAVASAMADTLRSFEGG